MKKAIVLDIDNVILDTNFIFEKMSKKNIRKKDRFKYFYEHCNEDKVKLKSGIKDFLNTFNSDIFFILSTARSEKFYLKTIEKLEKEKILFDEIYMRKEDDFRSSYLIKLDHFKEINKKYKILAFIDDELANCEAIKKLGILVLRSM